MKSFKVYRHIRRQALIFGLPVALFALQMVGVIGSLFIIIFSFSLPLVFGALIVNGLLYGILLKLTHQPDWIQMGGVFPQIISNKKTTIFYEDAEPA